jgi:hypothetical protein
MEYDIYAALSDDDKDGWVWLQEPHLPPFTPIEIHNPKTGRSVYCECRLIDENFLRNYNQRPRVVIEDAAKALVISGWYRDALGGIETARHSGHRAQLKIRRLRLLGWRQVRCACHHPDAIARIGTRLGILGAWLGFIGLLPVVLELLDVQKTLKLEILVGFALLSATIAWFACRGIRRGV